MWIARDHFVTVAKRIWGEDWQSINKKLVPAHFQDNVKIHKPNEEMQSFFQHFTRKFTHPDGE